MQSLAPINQRLLNKRCITTISTSEKKRLKSEKFSILTYDRRNSNSGQDKNQTVPISHAISSRQHERERGARLNRRGFGF